MRRGASPFFVRATIVDVPSSGLVFNRFAASSSSSTNFGRGAAGLSPFASARSRSIEPPFTSALIRLFACWPDPHWVSIVVPPQVQSSPSESQDCRVMLLLCSPACVTQPPMICSTSLGSIPARSTA